MAATPLAGLAFDNRFTEDLPADPVDLNRPRPVTGAAYSRVQPTPVSDPELVAHSAEVASAIGLSADEVASAAFAEVFSGNAVLDGMDPHAANYGGHQFGVWAGQLGDGRAITLGEVVHEGRRHTLQLKGSGLTPYSRAGDGLAVLRSSIREFLCSEAMHHLGVPTTRALSVIATGDQVLRDMFYDGRPEHEPGAVVCRVAPSFIRFGSFEIFTARDDVSTLQALADHTVGVHFPELGEPGPDTYVAWFDEVVRRTAELIVHWQRVGFVHGVMNTDNMSVHGLTIDYGPYGWLDDFDPGWTPNTTDAAHRRYRYGNQPAIAHWNLAKLANAILPLVGEPEPLQQSLDGYVEHFNRSWAAMMAAKIGLPEFGRGPDFDRGTDEDLLGELLGLLTATETDMTLFFRGLADVAVSDPATGDPLAPLLDAYYAADQPTGPLREATVAWIDRYRARIRASGLADGARREAMNAVNPRYVLRNYLAQLAIDDAAKGEYGLVRELLDLLRRPYDDQPGRDRFATRRPDWARDRPGCSQLSCSS